MALEVKKARFNPFVLPSDFFKADGDPVYWVADSDDSKSFGFLFQPVFPTAVEAIVTLWNDLRLYKSGVKFNRYRYSSLFMFF